MRITSLAVALALGLEASAALAQPNLRSTFPGRRIGGGTRGECAARLLAHLVPADSVFAAGPTGSVGLLLGPTADPRPLQIELRPQAPGGGAAGAGASQRRQLPAAPLGVTLLRLPAVSGPEIWESSYVCSEAGPASTDPLSFVEAVSPPALSLLVRESTPKDQAIQAALVKLRGLCGAEVARTELASGFGLEDVVTGPEWPERIPVRCP